MARKYRITHKRAVEIAREVGEAYHCTGVKNQEARHIIGMEILLENEGIDYGEWRYRWDEAERMAAIHRAAPRIDAAIEQVLREQGLIK